MCFQTEVNGLGGMENIFSNFNALPVIIIINCNNIDKLNYDKELSEFETYLVIDEIE